MSFDFWLLLAAGGSQFIVTGGGIWLALRPPNPKYHWLIVAAYMLVGVPGLGALVWEGLRTSNDLNTGMTKLQTGQQQGFSSIQQQIKAIPAPPKFAPQPRPAVSPKQHPLVVVTRLEEVPQPNGDMGWRLHWTNRGPITGWAPSFAAERQISEPMSSAQVDKKMAEIRALTFRNPPKRIQQVDVGEDAWRPLWTIPKSDWDDIVQRKKEFYTFIVLTSHDDALPQGAFWVNEWATVMDGPEHVYEVIRKMTFVHYPKAQK